jgi:hypothetical protein
VGIMGCHDGSNPGGAADCGSIPFRFESHLEKKVTVVPAPSEMPDPIFIKHFNLRHANDGRIEERQTYPDELATFRSFHRRLHEGVAVSKTTIQHEHKTGDPAQEWQDGTERQDDAT